MLDLIEGEVEGGEFGESVESLDVCDEVVVEVDFGEGGGGVGGDVDSFYAVLAEAQALVVLAVSGSGLMW